MKKERLIILAGILVALVFFYLGLNEWLKSKEEQVQPPPLVVKQAPEVKEQAQAQTPPPPVQEDQKAPQEKESPPQALEDKTQDKIAKKMSEEKKKDKAQETKAEAKTETKVEAKTPTTEGTKTSKLKTYTVQIGAFKSKDGAEKTVEKAKKMGYTAKIVEEDNFYKVRLLVKTEDINSELGKLRKAFGGAIVKQ